jgi:hypothetical protein
VRGADDPAGSVDQLGADGAGADAAWKVEASAPAARVRLWEITAQISHAESAVNLPEDRCVRAESSSGTSNHCYDSASICECIRS